MDERQHQCTPKLTDWEVVYVAPSESNTNTSSSWNTRVWWRTRSILTQPCSHRTLPREYLYIRMHTNRTTSDSRAIESASSNNRLHRDSGTVKSIHVLGQFVLEIFLTQTFNVSHRASVELYLGRRYNVYFKYFQY